MKTNGGYSQRQLAGMCTVFFLAPALRLVPRASSGLAGRAAWISVLAALPLLLLYVWFLSRFTMRRAAHEGLAELTVRALGAPAGRAALVAFALWFLLYSGFMLRSGADRIITTMYPNSSVHPFVLIMGLLSLLAALDSARTLVRAANLFLPAVLGVLVLVLFFALFAVDKDNILPLTVFEPVKFGAAALASFDVTVMPVYAACFLPDTQQDGSGSLRVPFGWAAGAIVLLFWLMTAIVGCFGAELTAMLSHAFFALVKNLVFFRNIERMEALVVSLWVFSDFVVISLCLVIAQHCLRLAMGKQPGEPPPRTLSMKNGRWVIWLCAAACAGIALIIAPDPLRLDLWSHRIIPGINLAAALGVLPLIYLVGRAKKTL